MPQEENPTVLLAYPETVNGPNLLQPLFSSAIFDAGLAMSRWTNSAITLSLDGIYECPPADVCRELNLDGELLTIVLLDLEGELGGTIVLIFTERDGRRLASSLLDIAASDDPEWTELECSALAETGNILFCAFADAITRLINRPLLPSVPVFVKGCNVDEIRNATVKRIPDRDTVLICRTGFHCERDAMAWNVLFIPTVALHAEMEAAVQPYSKRW